MKKQNMPIEISDGQIVTVTEAGEQVKVVGLQYRNMHGTVTKVDKNHYTVTSEGDGIIHECSHSENRSELPDSVRKSLNNVRDLFSANSTEPERCRLITLTYGDNMTEPSQLKKDWAAFCKKARRKWGHFEYIWVAEPQGRGAWHLHALLIFDVKAMYIDKNELYEKWGKGYVNIKRLRDGFNLGSYFSMHLRDMTIAEAVKAGVEVDEKKLSHNKKYIKGARLYLYPTGAHIYDHSKSIKRPVKKMMTKAEADELVQDKERLYQTSFALTDDDEHYINGINIEVYKDKKD